MELILDIEKKLGSFNLKIQYEGNAERIGILGASGCGKSMTLKAIAGIETPDRGRIVINGRTHYDSAARINLKPQKRRVGYLFQNYALFPTMTVEQNISAGLTGTKEENRNRTAEMVEKFQLLGLEKHLPGELSGGQQQRVALARIMAYRPEVLLLDEPFSAMDVFLKERLRLEMESVLKEYEGISVLVTHDRDEAFELCEHLLLMDDGRIIAAGPTKKLFEKPGNIRAAVLTGCKNISRVRILDSHRVCALDWGGLELVTEQETAPEITHIGIRAHDFYPAEAPAVNLIPVGQARITELPFEWYITIACGLWWKIPKDMRSHDFQFGVPEYLAVSPENIMLLKE